MHPVPGVIASAPSSNGYKVGFRCELMVKDTTLGIDAAEKCGVEPTMAKTAVRILMGKRLPLSQTWLTLLPLRTRLRHTRKLRRTRDARYVRESVFMMLDLMISRVLTLRQYTN